MSFKNPEKKRAYMKEYMARKRVTLDPLSARSLSLLDPIRNHHLFLDRTRPYHEEERYPFPAYLGKTAIGIIGKPINWSEGRGRENISL